MKQIYRINLRHLVRHIQNRQQLPANNNYRKFTCLAPSNTDSNISSISNRCSNNNNSNSSLQQHLPIPSRRYSKFSTHLNSERAMELLCNLDADERHNLRDAMFKLEADKEKKQYEIEAAEPPTARQLYSIFFVNAVPFVAFGFLDNFIMIMAGEYIESTLGHCITVSTMAAAGLGNTISDIMGITMATYVEEGCQMLGLKQPRMTPAQFELKSSKRTSSWGRIIGITAGCLIGMCPLWVMSDESKTVAED
ncbi:transmembrane protein 65 isoform X2 [Drosophila navojoa]|uniref:transmembrane protein 65 isoform X2 n=1 Tax=Drosophila navojoa TaxID=7232 RepID=UPI0011BE9EDF|nr:transmembrane protein 65 isoform X2 [Drosophila navojoa]